MVRARPQGPGVAGPGPPAGAQENRGPPGVFLKGGGLKMVRLFTAGGMIIDNVVTAEGTVHRQALGGNGVYSAAGARLWMDDVGIVATIPGNYPLEWLDTLQQAGIDIAGISMRPEPVTCSEWFFYRGDGSRVDRLYAEPGMFEASGYGSDHLTAEQAAAFEARLRTHAVAGLDYAAFRRLHPVRSADVPAAYQGARGVHLAPNSPMAQLEMARDLRRPGRRITLDPGSHAAELTGPALARLLPLLDAVLPSEKELKVMTAARTHAEGIAELRRGGTDIAVVKLAAAGAMMDEGDRKEPLSIPAIAVQAVDPTGAGDAFCGGFLAGLVATADPACAAVCATVSASFAVEAFGPFALFSARPDEVTRRWRELAQRCALPDSERLLRELAAMRRPPA